MCSVPAGAAVLQLRSPQPLEISRAGRHPQAGSWCAAVAAVAAVATGVRRTPGGRAGGSAGRAFVGVERGRPRREEWKRSTLTCSFCPDARPKRDRRSETTSPRSASGRPWTPRQQPRHLPPWCPPGWGLEPAMATSCGTGATLRCPRVRRRRARFALGRTPGRGRPQDPRGSRRLKLLPARSRLSRALHRRRRLALPGVYSPSSSLIGPARVSPSSLVPQRPVLSPLPTPAPA